MSQLDWNEIACFLSHRKAWQSILDRNLDAGLVFEDDAQISDVFLYGLEFALRHINEIGFIRFPFREGRERGTIVASNGEIEILKPGCIGLGLVAQLISKHAAEKLLDFTETFDRPVDTLLQMHWLSGIHAHSMVPGGVREISNTVGGTTLEKKSNIPMKLQRELLRPIYRTKISIRSRWSY